MTKDRGDGAPVFTVVMPVYNAEKYLDTSLQSILEQSFTAFELILVNDASKDQSLAVCETYAAADKRITVIDLKQNGGAAEARNRGIEAAKGTYLCFVDADDYVEPDFLQHFFEALQEGDYDLIKCGAYEEYYDADAKLLYARTCRLPDASYYGIKKILDQSIDMEQIPLFGYIWNSVYKVDVMKANNLRFDKKLQVNEDFDFNIKYLSFVRNMKCLSCCSYHYAKRNGNSLSSQGANYDYETHLLKIKSFLRLLKKNQHETQENLDKIYWMFTRFTFSALAAGETMETVRREELFRAFRQYRFGPAGVKKKLLTGILQSNNTLMIQPAVCLMGFVKHNLPVVFAKIKK